MKKILILLLLIISSIFGNNLQKEHLFVVSGVINSSGSSQKIENFVNRLESNSGLKLKTLYVNSYTRLSEILRDNPNALAWTCGAPYVEDANKDKQQLVAVPLLNGSPTYSSFIITRKENNKKRLTDFKDQIFVYSDLRSNSGYLAPSMVLKENGFDMQNFFKVKVLAGNHERSIEAVYRGLANVAAVDEYVWLEAIKANPELLEKLHVIEKSGPFPFTPIVAGSGLSKESLKNVQDALINMKSDDLNMFKKDFSMDGFVLKENSFYKPIENMLNRLKEK